jgi:hypothetical protein
VKPSTQVSVFVLKDYNRATTERHMPRCIYVCVRRLFLFIICYCSPRAATAAGATWCVVVVNSLVCVFLRFWFVCCVIIVCMSMCNNTRESLLFNLLLCCFERITAHSSQSIVVIRVALAYICQRIPTMHTYKQTYIPTMYTYKQTYIPTYIHTYTYTHIHSFNLKDKVSTLLQGHILPPKPQPASQSINPSTI